MRIFIVIALLTLVPALSNAQAIDAPAGFSLWNTAQIKERGDRLEKELGSKKLVYETLGTYKGHSVYLVLRGKTAAPEFHETEEDIQIGLRGTATFVVGGELVDRRKLPRKQETGSAIKGGARFSVGPGDVWYVPAATPHVLVIEPNNPFLYILIKVNEVPRNDQHK